MAITLRDVLAHGQPVAGQRSSRELIAYAVEVSDARDRLLANPKKRIGLVTAVARTVWMLAGNDRLADIEFYEPKVRPYADDELVVPGSSYGRRLFRPRPGLNQIEAVIGRLRGDDDQAGPDDGLRRAAAVIWEAEDAVRVSRDIPCAFGVFFHARDGMLVTTVCMRSNNATVLMPWNLFEFSILAEIVAVECGLALGPLIHWAASMHVYDTDQDRAKLAIAGADSIADNLRVPMAPMPSDPSPMTQATKLAQLEASLRHELAALVEETDDQLIARGAGLDPWWHSLYRVLLVHCVGKVGRFAVARRLAATLPSNFQSEVLEAVERLEGESDAGGSGPQLRLLEGGLTEPQPLPDEPTSRLVAIVEDIEADEDRELRRREFEALREEFIEPVAARGGGFERADVEQALRRIRNGGSGES